jgi:DNA-binding GntR family transcriptional regulator
VTSVDISEKPESIDTSDAAERAYARVLSMITSGELSAGSWLREKTLAEMTGVSRTPVRQALNRLGAEGLVELSRNRGAQVVSFSSADIAALYDVRARFEPEAVRLAVPRMSSDDLRRLAQLSDQMEKVVREGSDPERLTALNTDFHGLFMERCGNRHLVTALQAVLRPAIVTRTFRQYDERALHRSMLHHAELVEAAEAGDGEWAEAVMRAHILAARHITAPPSDEIRNV